MGWFRGFIRIAAPCCALLLATAVVARERHVRDERPNDREAWPTPHRPDSETLSLPPVEWEGQAADGQVPGPPAPAGGAPVSSDAWSCIRSILARHTEEEFLAGFPEARADFEEWPSDEVLEVATDWLAWLDLLDAQTTPGRRRFVARVLARARSLGEDAVGITRIEPLFQARVGRHLRSEPDPETRTLLLIAANGWEIPEWEPTFLEAVRERLADPNECVEARSRAVDLLSWSALAGDTRSFEAIAAIFDGPTVEIQRCALPRACYLLKSQGIPPGDRDRLREKLFLAMEAFPDDDYSDRAAESFAEGVLVDPPSLARALSSGRQALRAAAANALGKGESPVGAEVAKALVDAVQGVGPSSYRLSIVEALWRVAEGPEPSASMAREALQSVASSDEDQDVRAHASFALEVMQMAGGSDRTTETEPERTR